MLTFLQRILGRPKTPAPAVAMPVAAPLETSTAIPSVEVARLKLDAILERLPEELKPLVLKLPDESVTVALPISNILKQLASGAVKVSLATVHRQAPAGIFGPLPPGDKRLIDVPLAEVFRHVNPASIKRRSDQRAALGLDSEFSLFGNAQQPYQIAPTAPVEEVHHAPVVIEPEPALAVAAPMSVAAEATAAPVPTVAVPEVIAFAEPEPVSTPQRMIAPPPELMAARPVKLTAPAPAVAAPSNEASIAVPLGALSEAWPPAIREEIAALNGSAQIKLPTARVSAGLARGRVVFSWGEIRNWLTPSLPGSSASDDAVELMLPLKVIAPAFLVSSKKSASTPPTNFETDIPALFNDRRSEPPPAPEPEAPLELAVTPEVAPTQSVDVVPEPAAVGQKATSVGELFGDPAKTDWTPAELVAQLATRPGISGAVVALQEGLLVAHSLPADVKSEVIAAFLPQIFARLNQYSGEMKLGEVDDLLFTTHGAHCQIYRLGFVYFAVLGKPGEPLPWSDLRLVADELARQTQPKT